MNLYICLEQNLLFFQAKFSGRDFEVAETWIEINRANSLLVIHRQRRSTQNIHLGVDVLVQRHQNYLIKLSGHLITC